MQGRDDRSIGELFGDLSRETTTLIKQEINLAKTEMIQKASKTGKDVGFLAVGGAVIYAGLLAIIAGIIVLIGQVIAIPYWVSALGVGIIVALVGYMLVRRGLNDLKQQKPVPDQTIETLKEDKEWAQNQRG